MLAHATRHSIIRHAPNALCPFSRNIVCARQYATLKRALVTNYNKVAQHVIQGVENTKDNSLKQYFISKIKKTTNSQFSGSASMWTTLAGEAQSIVKSVDMDHKILSHLIFIKYHEGWTLKECAYVAEFVTKDWDLPKTVQFFGHFLNYYVLVPSTSLYKSHLITKNHSSSPSTSTPSQKFIPSAKQLPPLPYPLPPNLQKWTTREYGEFLAISMGQKDYTYMVPLLIRIVVGEPGVHPPVLDHVSSQQGPSYLSGIAKIYGVVLAYFPNWDFPFLGSIMRDLANVVPKFVHKHYTWWTYDLYIDFAVDVILHAAQVAQDIDKASTYNPRFINGSINHIMEGWNERDRAELMTRFYAVADDNDNFISFYLKKVKTFFGVK